MWLPHFFKTTRLRHCEVKFRLLSAKVKQELEEEFEKEMKMVICACGSIVVKVMAWTDKITPVTKYEQKNKFYGDICTK